MADSDSSKALHLEIDQQHVELRSLFETGKILNSSLDLPTILNNLLLTPMGRMMISRGLVLIVDDKKTFSIQVVKGLDKDLVGKTYTIEYHFEQPILLNELNIAQCKLKELFQSLEIEILLPIKTKDRLIGILALGKKITGNPYAKNELDFLNLLTNIASTAIENALIVQKLLTVNKKLDKKIQELNTLFDIGKELNSTLDKKKIVNLLIYAIMGEMFATRCYVFLENTDALELFEYKGAEKTLQDVKSFTDAEFLKNLGNINSVMKIDETVLTREMHALRDFNIKVVIPMRIQDQTKGMLLLGEKINKAIYDDDDIGFLSTLCNQAMISIENANLFDVTLEKQRMEEELNIAREIQQRLFPESFPESAHLHINGLNIPSREVGGDYFDCIKLDENKIALAIGDVSGKGAPASLLMSNLHAGLHSLLMTNTDINALVSKLNNLIYANTNLDKFITFFYAEIDLENNTMVYCNAGHNPPYLIRENGDCIELDEGGLLLGMMPNVKYATQSVELNSGDLVLMFTDGVTEAMNRMEQEFEEWRLLELLHQAQKENLEIQDTLNLIMNKVGEFTKGEAQSDDITLLGFKVIG